MPSEARRLVPSSRWAWLRSQGLGVSCGAAAVLLLAVGSVVIAATRGGASAGLRLDDVRPFFDRPSVVHLWFYLLIPLFGLYGLNTLAATWHAVGVKWRSGMRRPAVYAPAVLHVAFLLALVAHLLGGFFGEDRLLTVGPGWSALPDGTEVRVTGVEVNRQPDGTPRSMRTDLEIRDEQGRTLPASVDFNRPLSEGFGARLLLLSRPLQLPAAVLAAAGERCTLAPGERCTIGGQSVHLIEVGRVTGGGPAATVEVGALRGWLIPGPSRSFGELELRLEAVEVRPGAQLTWRRAPGNPWALGAALLLVVGVGLMGRRFLD